MPHTYSDLIPGLPGFQSAPPRAEINMSVTPTEHVSPKSERSGGSGLFPAIKTVLVDVSHENKVWRTTNLKSYGELDCG